MTRTEIVATAVRLLVTWLFVQALALTILAIAAPGNSGAAGSILYLVLLVIVFVGCALAWRFSVVLAGKVLPQHDPGDAVVRLSARDIERVAFRILGVFLVVEGLGGLGFTIVYQTSLPGIRGEEYWLHKLGAAGAAGGLLQSAIRLVAGIGLFIGTAGLRRALDVVKRAGGDVKPSDGEEPQPPSDEPPR